MRTLLFISLCCLPLLVFSQSFYIAPSPAVGSQPYEKYEIAVGANVFNNTASAINLRWVRIVENLPAGWQTAVCDINQCYVPSVDSMNFILPASGSAKLFTQMYINGIIGYGKVELLVYDTTGPRSAGITNVYEGTALPHFSLYDSSKISAKSTPFNSLSAETKIVNHDDNNFNLIIKRINNNIPGGWTTAICTSGVCFPTANDSVQFTINMNDTLTLNALFNTDGIVNTGSVDFLVYEAGDNNTLRWDTVTFYVETKYNFTVSSVKSYDAGTLSKTLTTELSVKNTADNSINLNVVRTSNNVPSGWSSALCTDTCLTSSNDTLSFTLPKDSTQIIYTKFYTDTNIAVGTVDLEIYETGDALNKKTSTMTGETALNYTVASLTSNNAGYPSKRIFDEGQITNVSSNIVHIVIKRIEDNLPAGWSSAICLTSTCTNTDVDSINFNVNSSSIQSFYVHFTTNTVIDSGNVKLQVYEIDSMGVPDLINADTLIFYAATKYSFLFTDSTLDVSGMVSQFLSGKVTVKNNSGQNIKLVLKRTLNNIPAEWASSLCETNCAGTNEDSIKIDFSADASKTLSVKFYTHDIPDTGEVSVLLYQLEGSLPEMVNSKTITFKATTALTGFNDELKELPFIIYPNPANNILNIGLSDHSEPLTLSVFNILGVEFKTLNIERNINHVLFSVKDIPAGIYYIRTGDKKGNLSVKSFLKSNY